MSSIINLENLGVDIKKYNLGNGDISCIIDSETAEMHIFYKNGSKNMAISSATYEPPVGQGIDIYTAEDLMHKKSLAEFLLERAEEKMWEIC